MHVTARTSARTTARRIARATLILATVPAVALLAANAAHGSATAASGGILVSTDGVTWQTGPAPGPLPAIGPLVPGADEAWTLHVRNASGSSATVHLALRVDSGPAALLDHLELVASAAHTSGPVVTPAVGVCEVLWDGPSLEPGESVRVDVTVRLDGSATNAAQSATARSTVYATLVEDTGGAAPSVGCPSEPSGPSGPTGPVPGSPGAIARTGSAVDLPGTLGAALAGVTLGAIALVAGRRRAKRERS